MWFLSMRVYADTSSHRHMQTHVTLFIILAGGIRKPNENWLVNNKDIV